MRVIKIFTMLLGLAANFLFVYMEDRIEFGTIVLALLLFLFASGIHLTLHECGHFVGGKLTGYRLLYLQVGCVKLSRNKEGKLSFKIESGRGGQCIMIPSWNENVSYRAYNLGGILLNFMACISAIMLLSSDSFFVILFFLEFTFAGALKIITNIVPCCSNGVPNDGYIVKLLRRSKAIQNDYCRYLHLYAALFLQEEIEISHYCYQRAETDRKEELLYYNGIQALLKDNKYIGT